MSCSIAPTPRSCISSAEKPKQRPISSETMPTFMACIEALSPAPSVRTRMQSSRASTIFSTRAGVSASACALASRGRPATSSIVCRQAREASPYWRSQTFCASRCASRRRRWARPARSSGDRRAVERARAVSLRSAATPSARPAPRPGGAVDVVVGGDQRRSGQARPPASPPSSRDRSLCCGLQRTRPRPSERIVATCAGVVIRKLLSGNGCDIQPTSRWTNIPTRSAWTSISGVSGWQPSWVLPRRATADGA